MPLFWSQTLILLEFQRLHVWTQGPIGLHPDRLTSEGLSWTDYAISTIPAKSVEHCIIARLRSDCRGLPVLFLSTRWRAVSMSSLGCNFNFFRCLVCRYWIPFLVHFKKCFSHAQTQSKKPLCCKFILDKNCNIQDWVAVMVLGILNNHIHNLVRCKVINNTLFQFFVNFWFQHGHAHFFSKYNPLMYGSLTFKIMVWIHYVKTFGHLG